MRVIITGGSGFLGLALARRLLAERPDLTALRLVDQVTPPSAAADVVADERVEVATGDLTSPGFVERIVTPGDWADDGERPTVYHLASVVSAGAEADFSLGYAVNLRGSLDLLERCRVLGQAAAGGASISRPARFVFASSLATYGADAGREVDDSTAQRPETSYGVQKACVELLVNDHHRKGFIEGWSLRLPTVSVRPGKPNLAASGFASGIIREPLAGIDVVCPVRPDTVMAVISPRRVVDALVRVLDLDPAAPGPDRAVLLPGLPMALSEAVAEVEAAAADRRGADGEPFRLGRVSFDPDPDIQRIVDSWPSAIRSARAEALGLGGDTSVAAIVRQHIDDELDP